NTRSREISIRKILGASGLRIFGMLTTDLLKWIALAFLIAIPISFFGAQAYLQSFSYRTALSWWVFVLGGVIIMIVAFAVVGFRTIRASTANPVNSLRNL
ncbi:MAG TPA: FtsX-like permease family protein, partial [Puia sp.]|nr:FtsX-like permease family protein [Puia sp.]